MEEWTSFAYIMVISFSLVTLLAGLFTTYFGSGRSRTMGILFVILGIGIGAVWGYMCMGENAIIDVALIDVLEQALIYIVAAGLGFVIAAGVFLLAIMKV